MSNDIMIYDDGFGITDNKLGDNVIVNDVSLYDYNADLINYEFVIATINSDIYKKVGRHSYLINRYSNGNNGIKMNFYVGGKTFQQAQINCNNIIREFQKGVAVIKIGDSEFEYVGVLSSYTLNYTDVYHYYLLSITIVAVKRMAADIQEYEESEAIDGIVTYNEGVSDCGVLIAIESSLQSSSIKVICNGNEVTISNFSSYKYHVIDGLDGRVLCGSTAKGIFEDYDNEKFTGYVNNFANTDLVSFPVITPGEGDISVECNTGDVSRFIVKFYPTFII